MCLYMWRIPLEGAIKKVRKGTDFLSEGETVFSYFVLFEFFLKMWF